MPAIYSTAVKNARLDAVTAAIGTTGVLEIGTTRMQTVLATIALGNPAAAPAENGVLTFSGFPRSDASPNASGTPAAARIRTSSGGADVVTGLTAGTSGADVILDSPIITAGLRVDVISFAIMHAFAAEPTYENVQYASDDANQVLDIYRPVNIGSNKTPTIMFVHGGAWTLGDKENPNVVTNKVSRWVPMGITFISINYRFLDPLTQVSDVGSALDFIRANADSYGIDTSKIILMGHSSGGHISALYSVKSENWWLGTVILDGAALDLVSVMTRDHYPLYDTIFGQDPVNWQLNSPLYQLPATLSPMLLVCSTSNNDSCAQSAKFAAESMSTLLEVDMTHEEINNYLGLPSDYTYSVEKFMSDIGFY